MRREPLSRFYPHKQGNDFHVDLPRHDSFLLIAAYLASHNPVSSDSQIFSKVSTLPLAFFVSYLQYDRSRSRGSHKRGRPSDARELHGPADFPLERLFAIFHT